jgi:hypothetical protein
MPNSRTPREVFDWLKERHITRTVFIPHTGMSTIYCSKCGTIAVVRPTMDIDSDRTEAMALGLTHRQQPEIDIQSLISSD